MTIPVQSSGPGSSWMAMRSNSGAVNDSSRGGNSASRNRPRPLGGFVTLAFQVHLTPQGRTEAASRLFCRNRRFQCYQLDRPAKVVIYKYRIRSLNRYLRSPGRSAGLFVFEGLLCDRPIAGFGQYRDVALARAQLPFQGAKRPQPGRFCHGFSVSDSPFAPAQVASAIGSRV